MSRNWAVFLDPQVWVWLGGGLLVTLRVAALVVVLSLVTGTLFALARLSSVGAIRCMASSYIETVRALPVFLIILVTYFGFPSIAFEVSPAVAVTLALTIYATALIAEIVRAGILAVSKGQIEAARSLGLGPVSTFQYIIFPQAMRTMIPPLVGQYIILIKHTSIGSIVGLDELLRRGVILYNGFHNPAQTLFIIAVIYFALLYPLSMISRTLELRDRSVQKAVPIIEDDPKGSLAPIRAT
jgi:His/Glu/Gln/Arg/opine family amino acid ABC transporter permease subunit